MTDLPLRPLWLRPAAVVVVIAAHFGAIHLRSPDVVEPGSGMVEISVVSEPEPSPAPTPDLAPSPEDRFEAAAVSPPAAEPPAGEAAALPETPVETSDPIPIPVSPPAPVPRETPKIERQRPVPPRPKKTVETRRTTEATRHDSAAEAASQAAARAATEEARRAAAASYASLVLGEIRRLRHYPAAAREQGLQGVATVAFTIGGSGTVVSHTIVRSSGHALLDAAVHETMAAIRLPPPPGGIYRQTVPIRFELR